MKTKTTLAVAVLLLAGIRTIWAADFAAGGGGENFGWSANVFGTTGVFEAIAADVASNVEQGAADPFSNLGTAPCASSLIPAFYSSVCTTIADLAPEYSTWAMLATGLGALLGLQRVRRHSRRGARLGRRSTGSVEGRSGSQGEGKTESGGSSGTGFTLAHSSTSGSTNGAAPCGSLTLSGSKLCGLPQRRGNGAGTDFTMSTIGTGLTLFHSFNECDESLPVFVSWDGDFSVTAGKRFAECEVLHV